jgi:hypothetical protein
MRNVILLSASAYVTEGQFEDPAALGAVSYRGRTVAFRADPVRARGTSQTGAPTASSTTPRSSPLELSR